MRNSMRTENSKGERGAALVIALLTLALLLALTMGISLTAVSELGVSGTYGSQTQALQAAEAGLNHAASLVSNYTGARLYQLLGLRPVPLSQDYLVGNNPFTEANAGQFTANCQMITMEHETRGYRLRDGITGAVVTPEAHYRVSLMDDEPSISPAQPRVPNFNPGATYRESVAPDANNASIDKNNRIVIYSTGSYANASVTLEGWIAFLPFPALSANRDIQITGSADIRWGLRRSTFKRRRARERRGLESGTDCYGSGEPGRGFYGTGGRLLWGRAGEARSPGICDAGPAGSGRPSDRAALAGLPDPQGGHPPDRSRLCGWRA